MRDVCVIGVGQTPVGEHWEKSLRELAGTALLDALDDSCIQVDNLGALVVGNMLASGLNNQQHLGALLASELGLAGIEAVRVEAACGSGGAAFRMGVQAIASGMHDFVAVVGVEKMTDGRPSDLTPALAGAADATYEAEHGLSFLALNALLMQRYIYEYDVTREDFSALPIHAHRQAVNNPHAMFRFLVNHEDYLRSPQVAEPVSVLDSAGVGDGAAAVILCRADWARRLVDVPVCVRASACATDTLSLHDRRSILSLDAVQKSSAQAYEMARVTPHDIDVFELHDAFSIMAVLSLEAAGFADRGLGVRLAMEGELGPEGRIPISMGGGLKGRGHPVGATGVYQVVEVVEQLQGRARASQLRNVFLGMTQNIGGLGATATTHIFERLDG